MQKTLVTLAMAIVLTPGWPWPRRSVLTTTSPPDFASFKTYAHKDGTEVGQPLIDDRIIAAIDAELAAKGLTKSESNPDVFVVYHTAFDKQQDISTYSSGYAGGYGRYGWGYGGGWAGGTSTTQVRDILVGTLVIDIADAKKNQLAWRGMGVKEVDTQAKPEKRDKSINNAMKKIFKNYPPKAEDVGTRVRAPRKGAPSWPTGPPSVFRPAAWYHQPVNPIGCSIVDRQPNAVGGTSRGSQPMKRSLTVRHSAALLGAGAQAFRSD